MRIGIDCRSVQEPHPSGVSLYTRELVQAMLRLPEAAAHEFVLFGNGVSVNTEMLDALSTKQNVTLRFRRLPNKVLNLSLLLGGGRAPGWEWMFGAGADIAFVPGVHFLPYADESLPYVLTMHDVSYAVYPECFSIRRRLWHRLLRPERVVGNARRIVSVSEHTATAVHDVYGVAQEQIHAIHSGIPRVQGNEHHRSPTVKRPTDTPVFLTLCTIEPRKNIDTLLDAFIQVRARLPQARLVVAGGPGWKSRELLERMRKEDGVEYRGYVSEGEKARLLQDADVFLYPSLYEGFGFPPLEAQLAGVPVIAGMHSSLPEVLGNSALYTDVLNVEELARTMYHAATSEVLRRDHIHRGKYNALRFSWHTAAQHTLNVITSSI